MGQRTPLTAGLLISVALASCGTGKEEQEFALLEGEFAGRWVSAGVVKQGEVSVSEEGILKLEAGAPLTGIIFKDGNGFELPVVKYEVEFEARRVEGNDFFAAFTFPVRSRDSCATLVMGGWGGSLVGISCLNDRDASENFTRASIGFENGKWYRFRLQVAREAIKVWLGDSVIIDAPIQGVTVSMRPGDIEQCAPFGFASYGTSGEVRNLKLRK